jgi:hypothetical protein
MAFVAPAQRLVDLSPERGGLSLPLAAKADAEGWWTRGGSNS